MKTTGAPNPAAIPSLGPINLGRCFVHPAFDYLAIGGGLSLITAVVFWFASSGTSVDGYVTFSFPMLFLLSNSAHFAASTVRLYTKPGAIKALPFLTMGFPLVAVVATTLTLVFSDFLGRHFNNLYITWSPFHYSMQAYGLALMYCYRSGCEPSQGQRRLLLASCMATFALTLLLNAGQGAGIWWVVSWTWFSSHQSLLDGLKVVQSLISALAFALPLGVFFWLRGDRKRGMPLISLLIVLTNAAWFVVFPFMSALLWATVFHGLQYLAIVTIFHVKDQLRIPGNTRGWGWHSAKFYAMCVALGYALFACWPSAYEAIGFGHAESVMLVTAAINIHHFIVDAYIWKLRSDPNYKIVTDAGAPPPRGKGIARRPRKASARP